MNQRNSLAVLLLLVSTIVAHGQLPGGSSSVRPPIAPKIQVDQITPSTIIADGQPHEITISGRKFRTTTTVAVGGAGVTVNSVAYTNDRLIVATCTAALGATASARDVTATNDPFSDTLYGALTVQAPESSDISLLSISPGQLEQGETASFVVLGENIVDGCSLTVSGAGVTDNITATTSTSVTVSLTADGAAATGFRNITVTNPATDTDTLVGVLEITAAPVTPPESDFDIDQDWLNFYSPNGDGNGPWYLDQSGSVYRLMTDVVTDGTAFVAIAQNITLDLNGHSITYNDAASVNAANNSFESALAGTWDVSGAPNADRFAGVFTSNQVHLGSYSLRMQVPCADQYVESVGTVTLLPNTRYSFSGMLQRGNITTGGTSTPTAIQWCELVGTGGETTRRFTKTTKNNRGIQFVDTTFTTGATAETYRVRCGVTGFSGVDAATIYFDDIRVLQVYNYGILAGCSGTIISNLSDGTVTRSGSAAGLQVIGLGSITQGQGAGRECSPMMTGNGNNVTVAATVEDGIEVYAYGPLTNGIWTQSGNDHTFRHILFDLPVLTIRSRDQFNASVIGNNGSFEVDTCNLWNYPHSGIRSSNVLASSVHDCTFHAKNRFTNGFSINVRGPNTAIYNNTINNTGIYNGRGIACDQQDPAASMSVHDNVINVQSLPYNQEYGGALIAWAIQCESSTNVEIYNNTVTVYGDIVDGHECEAAALRLNNNPDTCHIHDNVFIAQQLTPGVEVACAAVTNVHGDLGNVIEDNEFRSNKNWFYYTDNTTDVEFHRLTFTVIADTPSVDARWWESDSSNTNESQKIDNWKFIDPVYSSATARATVEDLSWRRVGTVQYGRWDNYSVYWTATAHVTNGGSPVNGASVNFTDTDTTIQASGTTGAGGDFVAEVPEFRISGNTVDTTSFIKTEYNDYTVNVTAPYTDSATATIDSTETVNVVN